MARSLQRFLSISQNCQRQKLVHITDREGDIFEIYESMGVKKKKGQPAEYIVRSNHNRVVYSGKKSPRASYTEN